MPRFSANRCAGCLPHCEYLVNLGGVDRQLTAVGYMVILIILINMR